jgi:PEP-CTERM motif-containing protein
MRIASRIRFICLAAVAAAVALTTAPANATTINWTLNSTIFTDGGKASGTFSTDSVTGAVTAFDITTTAGLFLTGFEYDAATSKLGVGLGANSFSLIDVAAPGRVLELSFFSPLTSPGFDGLIFGLSGECGSSSCGSFRTPIIGFGVGSAASATPLPSTWGMMLLGLGILSFMGFRRRRTADVLAAA